MKHNATPKLNDSHALRSIAWLALLCTLILLPRDIITPAAAGDRSSGRFYMTGQMWTRNLVRGPQGQPIFAEFAADGTPIKEIGEAINEPLEHASVMSANDYRLEVARYEDLKTRFGSTDAKGHAILNRDAYSATSFKTLREGYTINKPPLQPATRSVVVRGTLTLLTVGTNPLLLESTINLNSIDREVVSNTNLKSLLVDAKGNVLYKTANNYGYRVSDIKQKSGESDPLCRPAYGIEKDRDGYSPTQDALCGPVLGAHVETQIFPGQYGGTLTGEQGRWAMFYFKSPCPGFNYRYTTDFYQTLFYTNFNPKGSALGQYFQRDEWADWCMGLSEALAGSTSLSGLMTSMAMSAIENSTAEAPRHMVNYVDVAAITGLAKFGNGLNPLDAIPGGTDATQYQTNLPTFTPSRAADLGLSFDFDGDGIPDPMDPAPVDYNKDNRAEEIGFYLNGKQPGDKDAQGNLIPPDLIRRLDTLPDYQHQGLLKQISQQDMKETDLYIYRVSNGQKIQERKGLNDINIYKDGTSNVSYLSLLRGPRALSQFFGLNFSDWQSATGINPALHVKQADHLRVGEPLKIILVNRRTGYIGTALTQMPAATSGSIDFPIAPIVMRPPNLKLKAQRQYNIEAGLTKDKERNYLIGFEGASLKSDTYVQVTTDWFDHDGTPLPGDLPGYTGRMAKITSNRQLGDAIAQFAIHPGSHQQLVQLSGQDLGNDHYYLHVNGEPADGSPDFKSLGAGTGVLQQRPAHYVPVLVPVFDEAETLRRKNEQRYALQTGQITPQQKTKIEPVHRWVYRPEMQFSVLDLDVKNINRTDQSGSTTDENGNVLDLYPLGADNNEKTVPDIARSDQLIDILFDLHAGQYAVLDPLGYQDPALMASDPANTIGKDFVFQLGAAEATAHFGTDQTIQFADLSHVGLLTAEDYLTINFIQNADAGNILWEFAFGVKPDVIPNSAYVSADDAELELSVQLPAIFSDDPVKQKSITLKWTTEGSGSFAQPIQTTKDGLFFNTLRTSRKAGDKAFVKVEVLESEDLRVAKGSFAHVGPFEVVPGAPYNVKEIKADKFSVPADGHTPFKLTAEFVDRYDNRVTDGTAVSVSIDGDDTTAAFATAGIDTSAASLETLGGYVTAELHSGIVEKPMVVTFSASNAARREIAITHEPIGLSVATSSTALNVDAGTPVTLTANVSNASDGTPIFWSSTLGRLVAATTVSGGQATATLYPADTTGDGKVFVSVAGKKDILAFTHESASTAVVRAKPTYAAIAGDATSDGSIAIEHWQGSGTYNYVASTPVELTGPPGQTARIGLGRPLAPNAEPIAHFPLQAINNGAVESIDGLRQAMVAGQVTTNGESLRFNGSSHVLVTNTPDLQIADHLFASLDFRFDASAPNAMLLRQGSFLSTAYELRLIAGSGTHSVQVAINTTTGSYAVAHPLALTGNHWYRAGLRYHDGLLEVELDDLESNAGSTITSIAATGSVINTDTPITVGKDLVGEITSLKIGAESSTRLLAMLGGGAGFVDVVFGVDGKATTSVSSAGRLNGIGQGLGLTYTVTSGVVEYAPLQPQPVQIAGIDYGGVLAGALFMNDAHAMGVGTNAHRGNSIALVKRETWGWLSSLVEAAQTAAGKAVDVAKSAAELASIVVGLDDFIVLAKTIAALAAGATDEVQVIEVTFAGVGAILTVATVISVGSLAPVVAPLKLGLQGFKTAIKSIGPDGLKAAVGMARGIGEVLTHAIQHPQVALEVVKDTAAALGHLAQNTGSDIFQTFVKVVRSPLDFFNWVKSYKFFTKACSVAYVPGLNRTMFASASRWKAMTAAALTFVISSAYAGSCDAALEVAHRKAVELVPEAQRAAVHRELNATAAELERAIVRAPPDGDGIANLAEKLSDDAKAGMVVMLREGRNANNVRHIARAIARDPKVPDNLKADVINRYFELIAKLEKNQDPIEVSGRIYGDMGKLLYNEKTGSYNSGFIKGLFEQLEVLEEVRRLNPGKVIRLEHRIDEAGNVRFVDIEMDGLRLETKNFANLGVMNRARAVEGFEKDLKQAIKSADGDKDKVITAINEKIKISLRGHASLDKEGALQLVKELEKKGKKILEATDGLESAIVAFHKQMEKAYKAVNADKVSSVADILNDGILHFRGQTVPFGLPN